MDGAYIDTVGIKTVRSFALVRRVVRRIECLRPISLTMDMAHIQDAMWLTRTKNKLVVFLRARPAGWRNRCYRLAHRVSPARTDQRLPRPADILGDT